MELDYAFFAERAGALSDGRLCVFGADADAIHVDAVPALFHSTLVCRFLLRPDEPLEGHAVSVDGTKPDGERSNLMTTPLNTVRNITVPTMPSGARLLVNVFVTFSLLGIYQFHISVDGVEVKTLRLHVGLTNETGQDHGNV